MKPIRNNVYLIGDNQYVLVNRRLYKLEECDDDMIAESYNGGDALPILPNIMSQYDENK